MFHYFLSDVGAFIYWVLIKFCRTSYEDEAKEENLERNIIVFIISIFIAAFVVIRIL